jgi:DNA-binding CsgD family transcriptional regulator
MWSRAKQGALVSAPVTPSNAVHPQDKPPTLDAAFQERIHSLWDDLAAFEAAKSDVAVQHLLTTVAGLIHAQNAYWMGAVRMTDDDRDPLFGWRPRVIRYLHPLQNDETYTRDRLKSLSQGRTIDEATVAQARLAGSYRARRLCDLVSPDWFKSDTYSGYVGRGVHDSLVVGVPVSKMAEGYYGFLRLRPNDPFTEAQCDIALYAMRGLTWFHRQVMLAEGLLVARSPLSPMERRVLSLLLTEQSEKAIAANLEVAPTTLHTYVRDVFRKFGVSGRNGLIALWLGRTG